jgi:hypothetical protein
VCAARHQRTRLAGENEGARGCRTLVVIEWGGRAFELIRCTHRCRRTSCAGSGGAPHTARPLRAAKREEENTHKCTSTMGKPLVARCSGKEGWCALAGRARGGEERRARVAAGGFGGAVAPRLARATRRPGLEPRARDALSSSLGQRFWNLPYSQPQFLARVRSSLAISRSPMWLQPISAITLGSW